MKPIRFIVLADADLTGRWRRRFRRGFTNAGQSCISAKRFIVVPEIADEFVARLQAAMALLRPASESGSNHAGTRWRGWIAR